MKRNRISEATGSGNAGHFKVPIVLSPQPWKEDQLAPFVDSVYSYNNAELAYEEADGDFKETPEERAKIERRTDRIAQVDAYLKSFYTGQNDDEGSNLADIEPPEKIIQQAVGPLKEDLAVWFGTKKKPKGSKQPKGPWVNICRKKEGGGHPPCGRPDADPKGYPKCRAAGVASKMSDSEKRAACSQKRRAEKKDPKVGKGNKPTMVSYKPKNESMKKTIRLTENELIKLVRRVLNEQSVPQDKVINLFCQNKNLNDSFREYELTFVNETDIKGGTKGGGYKTIEMAPNSKIPRQEYEGENIMMDVIPSSLVGKDYIERYKLDNSQNNLFLVIHKSNQPYFCKVDAGTDNDWVTYLNSL